jgi:hypothetical protein
MSLQGTWEGFTMKKRFVVLLAVFAFLVAAFGSAPQQVSAATYFVNFGTYLGASCTGSSINWDGVSGSFNAPVGGGIYLTYTEKVNGITVNSAANFLTGFTGSATNVSFSDGSSFALTAFPFTYVGVFTYTYAGEVISTNTVTVNCTSDGPAASGSIVYTGGGSGAGVPGPSIPSGYVLKYIGCTVAVYSEPDLGRPTSARLKEGQTWYVNPKVIKGKDGKNWQEVFVAGPNVGYIPSSCIK